jgi:UDP-galactopyranose mutase
MQVPIPINLNTINRLYGLSLTSVELEGWFAARAEAVEEIRRACMFSAIRSLGVLLFLLVSDISFTRE